MRVLVYGIAADKLGGIETYLFNMNKFMSGDTIFDYVVEGTNSIHEVTIEENKGLIYYIAPKKKIFKNINDWNKLLKEYKKESKIVYFNLYSLAWIFPVLIAKMHGYKVIVHAHNNNLHNCGFLHKSLHSFDRWLLKFVKIERYTNSKLSSEFFFGNAESEMIYNAIDTKRFAFNPDVRKRIREELNLMDKHVYGFSGRIAYQKNPLFLMEVFKEIKKIDDDAAFVVCGDGDMMEQTKEYAKKLEIEVLFLGSVRNIEDYYQAMDCYILPSRFEGLGIVLIEAQCSGLPCITSDYVVPKDAKVTDILSFISLDENQSLWAETAKNMTLRSIERKEYSNVVAESNFNIVIESLRLEKTILNE